MRSLVAILLSLSASLVNAAALWGTDASSVLTGSRDTSNGVIGTGQWTNQFSISWNISNVGNTWTYVYTVDTTGAGEVKDISHLLLEITADDSNPFNILPGSSDNNDGNIDDSILGPDLWTKDPNSPNSSNPGANGGNPNLPNDLYGIKFDFGPLLDEEGDVLTPGTAIYTIVTDRTPVWGVFYGKDGSSGGPNGVPVIAYSTALGFSDYQTNMNLTVNDFIVRPNGISAIPIPATVWLFVSAIVGLIGIARKKIT